MYISPPIFYGTRSATALVYRRQLFHSHRKQVHAPNPSCPFKKGASINPPPPIPSRRRRTRFFYAQAHRARLCCWLDPPAPVAQVPSPPPQHAAPLSRQRQPIKAKPKGRVVDTGRGRSSTPLPSRSLQHAVLHIPPPPFHPSTAHRWSLTSGLSDGMGWMDSLLHSSYHTKTSHFHWSSSLPSRDFSNCFLMRASSCGVKRESSARAAPGWRPALTSCPWEDEQS